MPDEKKTKKEGKGTVRKNKKNKKFLGLAGTAGKNKNKQQQKIWPRPPTQLFNADHNKEKLKKRENKNRERERERGRLKKFKEKTFRTKLFFSEKNQNGMKRMFEFFYCTLVLFFFFLK